MKKIFLILILFTGCSNYENADVEVLVRVWEADDIGYKVYMKADCHFGIFNGDYHSICDTAFYTVTLDSILITKEKYKVYAIGLKKKSLEKRQREERLNKKLN